MNAKREWRHVAVALACLLALACTPAARAEENLLGAIMARMDLYDESLPFDAVDFAYAPQVSSEDALAALLWQCRAAYLRALPLRLGGELDANTLSTLCAAMDWRQVSWTADGSGNLLLAFAYQPGARIADAHLRGSADQLSADEATVYRTALSFAEDLHAAGSDPVSWERGIFDFIQQGCVYGTGNTARGQTALGVFLDGEASRLGYLDAFAMLCEIVGIPVFTALDNGEGGTNAWSLVEVGGKWYATDVSYGEAPDAQDGFPYLYFNVGMDMIPAETYLQSPTLPGQIEAITANAYAYGNPAFPELARVPDEDALYDALVRRAQDGPVDGISWLCDAMQGRMEDFMARLSAPTADGRFLPIPGEGVQVRRDDRVYLRMSLSVVDLMAPREEGIEPLMAQYDLYDPELVADAIDFYGLPKLETEDDLRALMLAARDAGVRKLPLRMAPQMDSNTVIAISLDFDWAMVGQSTVSNWANETHTLLTCTYLSGVTIAQAHRMEDTAVLTDRELATYNAALAFFDTQYPTEADAVTRERSIYDFVQASSEYWIGKPRVERVEDVCTAADVLLDGRSNCAGFADAFAMLCDMAGFSVRNVPGTLEGVSHMWNLIELEGRWYMVDATKSTQPEINAQKAYIHFNGDAALFSGAYVWNDAILPDPQADSLDAMYPYGNAAFPGYLRADNAEALVELAVQEAATQGEITLHLLCEAFSGDMDALWAELQKAVRVTDGSWITEKNRLYLRVTVAPA